MNEKVSARRYMEQQEPNNNRITWLKPIHEETVLSNWTVWWDTSRRYRVVLTVSKYGGDTFFSAGRKKVVKQHDGNKHTLMVIVGKDEGFRYLELALQACEAAHCKRFKMDAVESNAEEVVVKAGKDRQDRVTVVGREGATPGKARSAYTGQQGSGSGSVRISFLGHPVTAAIRWMGKDGFSFAEARKVCTEFGVEVADATIRAQLLAGKNGQRGPAAELTQDQVDKVYAAMEES